jgi:gliding motility-associated-like protein
MRKNCILFLSFLLQSFLLIGQTGRGQPDPENETGSTAKKSADLINVTVVNDNSIEVNWALPDGLELEKLSLERLSAGTGWTHLADLPVLDVTYTDSDVLVHEKPYAYRLICGDITGEVTTSNEGQTLFLESYRTLTTVELKWNAYYKWPNVVERYELETKQEGSGVWKSITSLPATQLTYSDPAAHPEGGIWCWRVRAIEYQGYYSTSLSNETCTPVDLIIPNTFTPNLDGINDYWAVEGLELYPGSKITIYNRWGQVVAESGNPHMRWEGKDMHTQAALPDGAYYYTLSIPGREKLFKGYIMLLR